VLNTNLKISFLFGAGSSIPANLQDIKKMTEDFYNKVKKKFASDESLIDTIEIIKKVTNDRFKDRPDIESFMTIVKSLEYKIDNELLLNKYRDLEKIKKEEIQTINEYSQLFIRRVRKY
jgi:hypothetical protein